MILFGRNYWISLLVLLISQACISQENNVRQSTVNKELSAVGLVFHRFGDDRYPSTNTSLSMFENQLSYLKENSFKTFTINELFAKEESSDHAIFLTVDDGFMSFYKNAFPILKKYNCKATIFVNTESVGWADYMNWEQINELVKAGMQIGSHSHAHPYFLNFSNEDRLKQFEKDLDQSEKLFRENLGLVPKVYAYPYGEFDKDMKDILKQRGYTLAFAQKSGVWNVHSNRYAIPRFPASGSSFSMEKFKQRIHMKALPLSADENSPIQLNGGAKYHMEFMLDSIRQYNGLNCFFNNQYSSDLFTVVGNKIIVDLVMPENSRRSLLTFTTKNKNGDWFWWSILFVNPKYLN